MKYFLLVLALLVSTAGMPGQQDLVWVCPMDPDVRSSRPGTCPRCGMKLADRVPDPVEYRLDLAAKPQPLRAGSTTQLSFTVRDPWKDRTVSSFQVVHEKLFHLFVVSQDLELFAHEHPGQVEGAGEFRQDVVFPRSGTYRLLADFYPEGATPQVLPKTLIVPGAPQAVPKLSRDYAAKTAENLQVQFSTEPPQPVAGSSTQLHFRITPADGFEKLLGAWGHLLVASDDLIDLIHTHPFIADGTAREGAQNVQFNVTFPRPRHYRLWVQFQSRGVVNTARFDVPVGELK